MAVHNYDELQSHIGHEIECARYGDRNVTLECVTCSEVLLDFDSGDDTEQLLREERLDMDARFGTPITKNGPKQKRGK